jgi:hypothetical protein
MIPFEAVHCNLVLRLPASRTTRRRRALTRCLCRSSHATDTHYESSRPMVANADSHLPTSLSLLTWLSGCIALKKPRDARASVPPLPSPEYMCEIVQ